MWHDSHLQTLEIFAVQCNIIEITKIQWDANLTKHHYILKCRIYSMSKTSTFQFRQHKSGEKRWNNYRTHRCSDHFEVSHKVSILCTLYSVFCHNRTQIRRGNNSQMKTFIRYEMQLQSTNAASRAAVDIVRVIGNPIGTFAPAANQPMSV